MSYPPLYPLSMLLMRRAGLCAAALLIAAGFARAQSSLSQNQTSPDQPSATGSSSSLSGLTQFGDIAALEAPAPAAAAEGAGQYGNSGGYDKGGKRGFLHNWTFEAGGGFNGPIGNDTGNGAGTTTPAITWGGNFTFGGGLRFNKYFSALAEYQFIGDKLPGALISAVNDACQADPNCGGQGITITAGNTHINSITGSPVIDLFPKRSTGIYLVGGWGWYHKSTNFETPQLVFDQFGDEFEENVTASSFTSNQWGGNLGFGISHRMGGMYGDSKTKIFAEARYTFIHTPPITASNGLGTTELIPVTLGLRF